MIKSIFAPSCRLLLCAIVLPCGMSLTAATSAQTLSHGPDPLFHDGFAGITMGPTSDSDAARFLAQATFGPTDADITHLRSLATSSGGAGYQAWLNEQFAAAATLELPYLNWVTDTLGEGIGQGNRQEAWFLGALGGPDPQNNALIHNDQLRQRVAFALSEILVTSEQNPTLDQFPKGMAYVYDLLIKNAFGNYRTLLQDVTLSPAMGVYLNMMGNRRAVLSQNQHPDENYGREINQLFSVGLVMLNLDGTPVSPTTPTYTQATITSFAHVFTGWNWADCDADDHGNQFADDNFLGCGPDYDDANSNFIVPMVAFDTTNPLYPNNSPSYHDNGSDAVNDVSNKQLLSYAGAANGGVLANGGTAASDLAFALDNIYNHPNVGPFISKQLIQRLVTSNPSPAYVQRVATVFNTNRASSTQLQLVVQAILLDPEARYGQWQNPVTFGKLREPLLTLTHYYRAMHAQHSCGQNLDQTNDDGSVTHYRYGNQPYRYAGYSSTWSTDQTTSYGVGVDQASQDAVTVFNFFKPGYIPPGEMTTRNLLGPEFQISTDSVIAGTSNTFASNGLYGNFDVGETCDADDLYGDVKINHGQDIALAGSGQGGPSDPADRLLDAYNKRFMSGQMSPYMRNQLLVELNKIDHTWGDASDDWRLQRIYRALYMILTSPEYMIQK